MDAEDEQEAFSDLGLSSIASGSPAEVPADGSSNAFSNAADGFVAPVAEPASNDPVATNTNNTESGVATAGAGCCGCCADAAASLGVRCVCVWRVFAAMRFNKSSQVKRLVSTVALPDRGQSGGRPAVPHLWEGGLTLPLRSCVSQQPATQRPVTSARPGL